MIDLVPFVIILTQQILVKIAQKIRFHRCNTVGYALRAVDFAKSMGFYYNTNPGLGNNTRATCIIVILRPSNVFKAAGIRNKSALLELDSKHPFVESSVFVYARVSHNFLSNFLIKIKTRPTVLHQ